MKRQTTARRKRGRAPRGSGAGAILALGLLAGGALAAPPAANAAPTEGRHGELYGYHSPGQAYSGKAGNVENGEWNNWSGSYRLPDGGQGFCADHLLAAPKWAASYFPDGELTMKHTGDALSATVKAELGYTLFQATKAIEAADAGGDVTHANKTAAAAAFLLHSATGQVPPLQLGSSVSSIEVGYDAAWYRSSFLGQPQTRDIPALADRMQAEARTFAGPWTVSVTGPGAELAAGETITFSVSVTGRSGHPLPGVELALATTALGNAPATVTTGADGTATFTGRMGDRPATVRASTPAPPASVTVQKPVEVNGLRTQRVVVATNETVANAHTQVSPRVATLRTSAEDQADGDRLLAPEGGTIIDVLSYSGLLPEAEHTVRGELVDQLTGEPVGIEATARFEAKAGEATTSLAFEVPPGYAGRTLVAFERILTADGRVVAEHRDLADEAQTVSVGEVELRTSATDQADGDRRLAHGGGTIADVVSYRGLVPGQEYTVTGELMDRTTGQSTGLTAETTFTATEHTGTVTVLFRVPSGFAGTTLVAFERLFDASGELIAEHTDLDDEEQTVRVELPPLPATELPSAGGSLPILGLLGGGGLLLAGAAALLLRARRSVPVAGER